MVWSLIKNISPIDLFNRDAFYHPPIRCAVLGCCRGYLSGPGFHAFLLDCPAKDLDIVEELMDILMYVTGEKPIEEVIAEPAFDYIACHESAGTRLCPLHVASGTNEGGRLKHIFDICPFSLVFWHPIPMFVCGRPCRVIVVSVLDEVYDERVDFQQMRENWLNLIDEWDPIMPIWKLSQGLLLEC